MEETSPGCGTCSMCCRLMTIDDLVPCKPEGKWCPHVVLGTGCGIYDTRPQSCRNFECLWLQTQKLEPAHRLSVELRPDRCKVMLVPHGEDLVAKVDPGRPDAFKAEPIASLLKVFLRSGARVFIGSPEAPHMLKERKK